MNKQALDDRKAYPARARRHEHTPTGKACVQIRRPFRVCHGDPSLPIAPLAQRDDRPEHDEAIKDRTRRVRKIAAGEHGRSAVSSSTPPSMPR